ncbi:unnamed protein product [Peronospora destructor]|uniref:Phosphatidate cytidylyltransferase n=1 Tax=Peronospora destructor TaxID=86335 RepID=A0AAV0VBP3_9STRA|nr:unnamed protein product [Peronospora destructor]
MAIAWRRRVLTALVGIPTALYLLSFDVGMLLLATILCCLSLVEFTDTICLQIVPQPKASTEKMVHRLLLVASGTVLCVGASTGVKSVHDAMNLGATLAICTYHIATARKMDQMTLIKLLLDLFALLYIVNGFSHAILLSGALVAGSLMGDTKLAPIVSPGKTLVGAIAGVTSSIVTVLILFALPHLTFSLPAIAQWTHELLPPLDVVPLTHQVMLGILLGVLCILGDLVESFVKRIAGVKDSGSFFPGHGGCLDRMDSFLFVAPCLYFYSQFVLFKPM